MRSIKAFFSTFEFRRKAVHLLLGLLFIALINTKNVFLERYMALIFAVALAAAISLSAVCKYLKPRLLMRFLEIFDKPKDLEKFPGKGAVFYLMGMLSTLLLFDRKIASAAIIILAVGDPVAHFFGRYYGKTKHIINKKKLLEGTLAGIFFGGLAASLFVPWPFAFFGAAFGMIAEAVELELINLDDNFFIPLVAGGVMQVIALLK